MLKNSKTLMIFLTAALILVATGIAQQPTGAITAKDPVCGMSVKIDGAKYTADYKGTKYYFCSEGCKTQFTKSPEKYLTPNDAAKPMGGMMMQGAPTKQGEMESCPMMMKDVEKTFTNTKDGVTITLSAKSPETVKKIQDWAAKMKEGKSGMAGHNEEGCPMGSDCPKMKK
jgi:YHS domain-containing protein